jgi:poly(A) polymerase
LKIYEKATEYLFFFPLKLVKRIMTLRDAAVEVVKKLRSQGFEAYFAGGCVRDHILKLQPKDYDVATSALPDQVENIFPKTVNVGKAFGVIRARLSNHEIEIATFRCEGKYLDGRRPSEVRFTSAKEDAQRRDFTINGLFYDPIKKTVLDYVHGQKDVRSGLIRCIGNPEHRFKEDHLRILRCVRFAAQLGFKIEPKTWRAVRKMTPKIRGVSAERIRDELNKLLTAPFALQGLKLLDRSGLLAKLLPEIVIMKGVNQPRQFHPEGDVFVHTLKVFSMLRQPSMQLAWAALLHDVGKPPTFEKSRVRGKLRIRFPEHARVGAEMTDVILNRLKFSSADKNAIVSMVENHMTFKDVKQMRLSTLKRLMARPTFAEELKLHRADCLGCHGNVTNVRFLQRKQKEFSKQQVSPPKLISGQDLIAMGLDPGPLFGRILKAIEEAQLEGTLHTKEEALKHVKELMATVLKNE